MNDLFSRGSSAQTQGAKRHSLQVIIRSLSSATGAGFRGSAPNLTRKASATGSPVLSAAGEVNVVDPLAAQSSLALSGARAARDLRTMSRVRIWPKLARRGKEPHPNG